MPKTDEERLLVLVEARINDLEKNMAKASRTADKNYDRMRRSSRSATRGMERDMQRSTSAMNRALATTTTKVGAFGKAFAVGGMATAAAGAAAVLAPILSVGAALTKARSALEDFDKIAKSAKATGLDGEFFQELTYQADLGGVGIDQLSVALQTFNRNAGMAIVNQGELVSKLKQLDPVLLKNIQNATTQEERIRLVADAIQQEADASRRAALAAAAFGDAGVRMVEVFKGGSEAIDQTAQKARELGIVVDNEVLASAEEMNDQLNTATRIMNTQFSKALVDLAPILISTAELAADVASAIAATVDAMRSLDERSTAGLEARQSELAYTRMNLENRILAVENNPKMTDQSRRRVLNNLKKQLAEANREDAEITQLLNDRNSGGTTTLPPITVETDREPSKGSKRSKRDPEASRIEAERRALERYIQSLEDEARMLSMTEEQKRAYIAARNAGTEALPEEIAYVQQLTESIHDQTEAQQQAAETAEFFKGIAVDSFAALIPVIDTGNDALDSLINKLIEATAQAALLGEGPLASLFGGGSGLLGGIFSAGTRGGGQLAIAKANVAAGLVTGLYADGTDFAPGGPAIVGERGPELVNLPRGAQVIPNHQIRASAGGSSTTTANFNMTLTVNGTGDKAILEQARIGAERQMNEALDQFSRRVLPGRVQQINRNPNRIG
ncbi:hypothetical protein [Martelella mediterranea]|uniref:Uncharacterized protein n=1 Tax=Martelella mediterranea DSM 17316 TaxID=1122214 RepID=A0A1U9YYK6_9HYPH|nr:hypothetical protein [Martelella mediterranea]AQZ50525.1 hypothetical protein Mame_01155 [Martelella mediterranea DSM 17316]